MPRCRFSTRGLPSPSEPGAVAQLADRLHRGGRGRPSPSSACRPAPSSSPASGSRPGALTQTPASRDLPQQRVGPRAVEAVLERAHPDQHAVEPEQLIAHRLDGVIAVDDRLRPHAQVRNAAKTPRNLQLETSTPSGCGRSPAPTRADRPRHQRSADDQQLRLPGCSLLQREPSVQVDVHEDSRDAGQRSRGKPPATPASERNRSRRLDCTAPRTAAPSARAAPRRRGGRARRRACRTRDRCSIRSAPPVPPVLDISSMDIPTQRALLRHGSSGSARRRYERAVLARRAGTDASRELLERAIERLGFVAVPLAVAEPPAIPAARECARRRRSRRAHREWIVDDEIGYVGSPPPALRRADLARPSAVGIAREDGGSLHETRPAPGLEGGVDAGRLVRPTREVNAIGSTAGAARPRSRRRRRRARPGGRAGAGSG